MRELGRRIAAGQAAAGRGRTRALEDRGMELLSRDPALKAALFRLVDVAPACSGPREVAAHLASLLGEVERPLAPVSAARRASLQPATSRAVGGVAGLAVHRMAKRFIVGAGPAGGRSGARSACGRAARRRPSTCSARRPSPPPRPTATRERCDEALRTLAQAATPWPARPTLEADSHGPIPRVNLSRQGHRAHRPRARRGARARHRGRQAPAARPPPNGQSRSARTCTSTWSRWTRAT